MVHTLILALALVLCLSAVPSAYAGGAVPAQAAADEVLAEGSGGDLTREGADAFVDALQFTLEQLGRPADFDDPSRAKIRDALASHFGGFPPDVQGNLANARAIVDHYLQAWPRLGGEERHEFAYAVLAIAFGEQAAADALGGSQGGASGGAGGAYGLPDVDAPGPGSDCWAAAGCADYDAATGTYSFEE
jgi:hypothetical protein